MNHDREHRQYSPISHTVATALMRIVIKSAACKFAACRLMVVWRKAGVP
ncbi:MAG: hypothetical protein ACYTBV_21065 [Planctomycetota bacterium]|jgi:hypothetical protein